MTVERKALHATFGGRTQGGIGPSKVSPNVFLFSDPISGARHGYVDGWQEDGCYHYTGEGQFGDQRMISGNRSILDHKREGRALRVFRGARGAVTYLGEFELDEAEPYYETDAPESGGGQIRKVIVFRMRPLDSDPGTPVGLTVESVPEPAVSPIPIERHLTEMTFVNPSQEPHEAERTEAELVSRFADYLRLRDHDVVRHQILPPGERKPLFTDLYVKDWNLLVEAKGSVTRESIRMAIGQLADYARYIGCERRAVLLPAKPRPDLMSLLESQRVTAIWLDGSSFESSGPVGGAGARVD